MRCGTCGTDNPAGMRFCGGCAAPLARVCPSCGAAVVGRPKYCGECAAPLTDTGAAEVVQTATAAPAPVSERRVCTVLFADLVGFTPLSEARDPEEVRELLSRYFDVARTIVGRYGGTVEKFIGDAVMAVWGTPVAAEGDADRAVRAALELVDAVAALGAEVGVAELAARAGLVTGDVAVTIGAVGEGMVAGDAVNTAARVQAAADPGSVFVDTTTRHLAVAVGFEDAGEHMLKGKAEAQGLWRATRVLATSGGTQRVDGLEARLIGRDAELRLVKELFHVAEGRDTARLVLATGVAGVGKSRLGWEFEKYIDGLSTDVFWHRGRCLSYGEGVAFWALAEAVRQRLGIAEEDATDVAAHKLADGLELLDLDAEQSGLVGLRLGRLLGVPVAADDGRPMSQEDLFAGWRMFFERLASTAPVVWLVEDAQHADVGLLDFLDHLTDWTRDLPIFVLVLARSEIAERRQGFGVGRNRTILTLDPLDATSMDELVEALVPGMPEAAKGAITRHAQGIPLFAVETIRSLVDRDVVVPIEGSYRLVGDVGELAVPDSLHSLLAARLDALDPAVRSLVSDAAVLGSLFPAEALVAVSALDEAAVRAGLADLVRREVLEISADPLSPQRGSYRFTQNLLRQVAYETLSRRDRKTRHLLVAAHLRAAFADDGEELSDVIARHYLDALAAIPDADDAEAIRSEALAMSIRSAERALRGGAPATAARAYATAAEYAEVSTPAEAARLWEAAAAAANVAADYERVIECAEHARAAYQAAGQQRAAARAQMLIGRALGRMGRALEGRPVLEAALAVLRPDPDRDTVEALAELAGNDALSGHAGAEELSIEAIHLAQALGVDDALLGRLFMHRGFVHNRAGRTRQAVAYHGAAVRLLEGTPDRHRHALALGNYADALASIDPAESIAASRRALELAREVGTSLGTSNAVSNLCEELLVVGQWDEAERVISTAVDDGIGDDGYVLLIDAMLHALRGDAAAAKGNLGKATGLRESDDPQDRAMLAMVDAFVADLDGDPAALDFACAVVDMAGKIGLSDFVRWAWSLAVRTAHRSGDTAAVAKLIGVLDARPVGHVPPVLRAERDLARARLAAGSDPAAAGPLYDAAITGLREIPAVYNLAQALADRAEFLQSTGDETAARADLDEAHEIAARLRAGPLLERLAVPLAASR